MMFVAAHADENLQMQAQRAYARGGQLDEHPAKIGKFQLEHHSQQSALC